LYFVLETVPACADKRAVLGKVVLGLRPGGRFAFAVEEGHALTSHKRAQMPDGGTVWLVERAALRAAAA
jgi:hypothetical protein